MGKAVFWLVSIALFVVPLAAYTQSLLVGILILVILAMVFPWGAPAEPLRETGLYGPPEEREGGRRGRRPRSSIFASEGGPPVLKSWIWFLCFFETALLLAIFYEDTSISFLALYTMLLLFACAVICALFARRSVKVGQGMDKTMLRKGEPVQFRAVVSNRSLFFFPRLQFEFYGEDRIQYRVESTALRPFSATELSCTVTFPYRGIYEMGVRRVVVTDFLGLFRVKLPECPPLEATVYPSSDPAFRIFMSDEMQNTDRQSFLAQDYTDVADVRKHTESDTFRHVHWKLSSKRGEFIVKNYQSKAQSKALLLIDAREMPFDEPARSHLEDRLVSYVAAAAEHCLHRQIPAELYWGIGEQQSLPVSRARGLRGCWRTLAALPFESARSFLPAVPDWLDTSVPAFHMLCFLMGIDIDTYQALNRLASGEHRLYVFHFHLPEKPPTEGQLQMLQALRLRGVSVTIVDASQ